MREGLQSGQASGDEANVECMCGQVEPGFAGAAGDAAGDGEEPEAEAFGFPHPGVGTGECEHLHPRGEFGGSMTTAIQI